MHQTALAGVNKGRRVAAVSWNIVQHGVLEDWPEGSVCYVKLLTWHGGVKRLLSEAILGIYSSVCLRM